MSLPVKGIRALGRRPVIVGLSALLLGAVIASLAIWNLKPAPASATKPVTRTVITLPPGERLALGSFATTVLALSPDGSHLAYVAVRGGTQQVYLRPMDSLEARPLPGTDGAVNPFFSANGHWLGFFAVGKLKKISVNGGAAVTLADAGSLGAPVGAIRARLSSRPT